MAEGDQLHAEQRARALIDSQSRAGGWRVCDVLERDLINHPPSAFREVRMKAGHGQVDYLLYVDRMIVGVIEAKPAGNSLSGVEWQSAMYAAGSDPGHMVNGTAGAPTLAWTPAPTTA